MATTSSCGRPYLPPLSPYVCIRLHTSAYVRGVALKWHLYVSSRLQHRLFLLLRLLLLRLLLLLLLLPELDRTPRHPARQTHTTSSSPSPSSSVGAGSVAEAAGAVAQKRRRLHIYEQYA